MKALFPVIIMVTASVLAGCATTSPAFVDASNGGQSTMFALSVGSSAFPFAPGVVIYQDGKPIANIGRGDSIVAKLPCGEHTYSIRNGSTKTNDKLPLEKTFDPCDGGKKSLRVAFTALHGFYLARE